MSGQISRKKLRNEIKIHSKENVINLLYFEKSSICISFKKYFSRVQEIVRIQQVF